MRPEVALSRVAERRRYPASNPRRLEVVPVLARTPFRTIATARGGEDFKSCNVNPATMARQRPSTAIEIGTLLPRRQNEFD
jgi:hypothetical protein